MYLLFRSLLLLVPLLLIAISIANYRQYKDAASSEAFGEETHEDDTEEVSEKETKKDLAKETGSIKTMLVSLNALILLLFLIAWLKLETMIPSVCISLAAIGLYFTIAKREYGRIKDIELPLITTLAVLFLLVMLSVLETFFLFSATASLF